MAISNVKIWKPKYPSLFGGMGFNNLEASAYPMIEDEYMNQYVRKCNRELAPGFSRLWGGFAEWTKEAMDAYFEYYTKMQAETNTTMYLVPGRARSHKTSQERRQWASDVADRLAYLYHEKGMKHLKYYCMSNELSLDSSNGAMQHQMHIIKEYHEYLFREFQKRNLPVGLLAPDVSGFTNYSSLFWSMANMKETSNAFTAHEYLHGMFDAEDLGMYKFFTRMMARCVSGARGQEKLFLLSEYGWGQFHGNPATADGDEASHAYPSAVGCTLDFPRYAGTEKEAYSQLAIAEMNLASINAGVFATGYWSFVDYPDPQISAWRSGEEGEKISQVLPFMGWGTDIRYNKCGVLRWNDFDNATADSYWCLGIMTRFMKQNTHVLYHQSDDDLIRLAVLQDQEGHVSICLVNRHAEARDVRLELGNLVKKAMRMYQYDPQNIPRNRFADLQDPIDMAEVDENGVSLVRLAGNTVTVLTTDYEDRTPPMAQNLRLEDGRLTWDAVVDVDHRYYRVFADGIQVASTVETSIPVSQKDARYQVCSVDKYNNCAMSRR